MIVRRLAVIIGICFVIVFISFGFVTNFGRSNIKITTEIEMSFFGLTPITKIKAQQNSWPNPWGTSYYYKSVCNREAIYIFPNYFSFSNAKNNFANSKDKYLYMERFVGKKVGYYEGDLGILNIGYSTDTDQIKYRLDGEFDRIKKQMLEKHFIWKEKEDKSDEQQRRSPEIIY